MGVRRTQPTTRAEAASAGGARPGADRRGALVPVALLVAGLACAGEPPSVPEPEAAETRATMADLVTALRVVLPLALSEERFAADEHEERIGRALAYLRASASTLDRHARNRDATFRFLSHTLARDAEEIERRFLRGRPEEARFLLGDLVDDCVGCHASLPGGEGSELGRALFRDADADALEADERVRLLVATRQFDRALEEIESLLGDEDVSPAALDLRGLLGDYLRVAIRVRRDPGRAHEALAGFLERTDVPVYLREIVAAWVSALGDLEPGRESDRELARAQAILRQGQALRRFPADRTGLVHDLVAATLLQRVVGEAPENSLEAAEAYYLLGLAELRSELSPWRMQGELYLETAIRAAPGSRWAREAFAVLEETTLAGYSGSGGTDLPPDVARWLGDLRTLAGAGRS